jgi:hypothetical protein
MFEHNEIVNLLCKPKGPKICAICHIDKREEMCYDIMGENLTRPGNVYPGRNARAKILGVRRLPLVQQINQQLKRIENDLNNGTNSP